LEELQVVIFKFLKQIAVRREISHKCVISLELAEFNLKQFNQNIRIPQLVLVLRTICQI